MPYPTDIDNASIIRVTNVNPVTGAPALGTGDANTNASTPIIGIEGYNGTTWDRLRISPVLGGALGTGPLAAGIVTYDTTASGWGNIYSLRSIGDADNGFHTIGIGPFGFNGTSYDRLRTTTAGAVGTQRTALEFTFTNVVAGIATTVIKASAGILHSIVFNSAATATNVTTIYDNASGAGTVIAIPAATTATVPTTLVFDCKFTLGLTVITTTANGSNMTFNWM